MEASGTQGDPIEQLRRFADDSTLDRKLAPIRAAEAATYLAVIISAAGPARVSAVVTAALIAATTITYRGVRPAAGPIPLVLATAKLAAVGAIGFGTDWAARAGATWGLMASLVVLAFAALSKIAATLLARHDARSATRHLHSN